MTSALKKKLLLSLNRPIRPQDVFATSLYTGNGGTQTITNGLDLAGRGGLVWTKARSLNIAHILQDTIRGAGTFLSSNETTAETNSPSQVTSFGPSGYSIGAGQGVNGSGQNYVNWSFRRAKKFFDIVTYTGNGQSGRQIPHGLGDVPGMIVVKARTGAENWAVWHRANSFTNGNLILNSTAAAAPGTEMWNSTSPTASVFTVGNNPSVNDVGIQYVAYLFAHNPDLIQCGNFVVTGSNRATINHGWANGAQFLLYKATNVADNWIIVDRARSPNWSSSPRRIAPNTNSAELLAGGSMSDSGGVLTIDGHSNNSAFVSMLIRSPT